MNALPARFWSKVDKRGPYQPKLRSRCWLWLGALSAGGYGRFRWNDQSTPAHRLVLGTRARKLVPYKIEPDHLCPNRHCVNPKHLEVVTRRINTLRGNGPAAINARKTRCPAGHLLIGTNIMLTRGGKSRRCRECNRLRCQRLYAEGKK